MIAFRCSAWYVVMAWAVLAGNELRAAGVSAESPVYGALPNPTGDPIGGGEGYRRILAKGDLTVHTADDLLAALPRAKPGQVIYVAPDAQIDLTGHIDKSGLRIPRGVILAGNRGQERRGGAVAPGPIVFCTRMPAKASFLFTPAGDNRFTGLRGPDGLVTDADYAARKPDAADGRSFSGAMRLFPGADRVEVDNCEIYNFSHASINTSARSTVVRHCDIHDIHIYGIITVGGDLLFEANRIEWYVGHALAGKGAPGERYEARYNIVTRRKSPPNAASYVANSHAFDMHPWRPTIRTRLIAGDYASIHHNTFAETYGGCCVRIRGIPRDLADIHHNLFPMADPAACVQQQSMAKAAKFGGNIWVHDNAYGPEKKTIAVAELTTPRIRFINPPPPTDKPCAVGKSLPLKIAVDTFGGIELKSVKVMLDGQAIYEAAHPPGPGDISLNASGRGDGPHLLSVAAADVQGRTAVQTVDLVRSDR